MSLKRIAGMFGELGGNLVKGAPVKLATTDEPLRNANKWERFWEALAKPTSEWDLEGLYAEARGGPVSDKPLVCVIVPTYRESEAVAKKGRMSRNAVRQDLAQHDIGTLVGGIDGDSLVCRMRQRACHMALLSPATHLLFWDTDLECLTPECVREMLATGHDVIAAACPFRDLSGRTVHNLYPEDEGKPLEPDEHGCYEVQDAGTGFMLVSRKALIKLQTAHPERLHISTSRGDDRGAPLWALFNAEVVDGIYQSEDYLFCHLWQEMGGNVYVWPDAEFLHWGEHGFRASFREQYGLK